MALGLLMMTAVALMTVLSGAWVNGASADPPTATKALVFDGNAPLNQGYTKFAAAVALDGVTTTDVLDPLPADLSVYRCIVLPANETAFGGAQTAALSAYVTSGGRIIALGDNSTFAAANATMNGLGTALGSGLSIVDDTIDSGFHVTTDIDSSPFTEGVSSIKYGAVSEVSVSVGASSLVGTEAGGEAPGTTFIGVDPVGSGFFFVSGDTNWISDNSSDAYTTADNETLVRNICSGSGQLVGGIVELLTDPESPHTESASSGADTLPIAASLAVGLLAIGAGGLYAVRMRRG